MNINKNNNKMNSKFYYKVKGFINYLEIVLKSTEKNEINVELQEYLDTGISNFYSHIKKENIKINIAGSDILNNSNENECDYSNDGDDGYSDDEIYNYDYQNGDYQNGDMDNDNYHSAGDSNDESKSNSDSDGESNTDSDGESNTDSDGESNSQNNYEKSKNVNIDDDIYTNKSLHDIYNSNDRLINIYSKYKNNIKNEWLFNKYI